MPLEFDLEHPSISWITLETRQGTGLPNTQNRELAAGQFLEWTDTIAKFQQVIQRTPPSGMYNCHGMTFASGRSGISDVSAIATILSDDGYVSVQPADVLPGDVLLYQDDDGDFSHSALVLHVPEGQPMVPIVVSKWGIGAEVVHRANNCPYPAVSYSYFRRRP